MVGTGKYLRTNYRLTGGLIDQIGPLNSLLLRFTFASVFAGTYCIQESPITISMAGYGAPSWIAVVGMSEPTASNSSPIQAKVSGDMSGSIAFINFYKSTTSYTGSLNLDLLVLIGSR